MKMRKLINNLLIFISIGLIGVSCSTDFDLNAPYQPIPIVYGLLDQSSDTQFVKINKSFLGERILDDKKYAISNFINSGIYKKKISIKSKLIAYL